MSGFINRIKSAIKPNKNSPSAKEGNKEQQFTIQPHPAKTNNPADLEPPQLGAGLNNKPEFSAHQTPGPYVPSAAIASNIEPPASREEMRARQVELNK
ncbi:hypothetical protein BD410DRAFT_791155 [Rickenella mellea]|uniref:Uncharacterized protein n=1 Tax=Rickenella mellea TaxID=50990 RepID=A0A4Y7PZB1_9AGAM|nr:hypothetical protein BD410DRAFT_791155 [Rickenella mellea]